MLMSAPTNRPNARIAGNAETPLAKNDIADETVVTSIATPALR